MKASIPLRFLSVAFLALSCGTSTTSRACVQTSDCTSGLECRLGTCRAPGQPVESRDSGMGAADGGPACGQAPNCLLGQACGANGDCKSQFCTGGVCCNEQCASECGSCALAGSVGTCKPKPKGTECVTATAYVCNGVDTTCSTSCTTIDNCSTAYACCLPGNVNYTECNAQKQGGTCVKFKPCSDISDDFGGPALNGTQWTVVGPPDSTSLSIANQRLQISHTPKMTTDGLYSAIESRGHFSLVDGSCSIQFGDTAGLKRSPDFAAAQINIFPPRIQPGFFQFFIDNRDRLGAALTLTDGGTPQLADLQYNPALHKFVRVREAAGVLYFEASPDGQKYTAFAQAKPDIRLSDLQLSLGMFELKAQVGANASATFDKLNTP